MEQRGKTQLCVYKRHVCNKYKITERFNVKELEKR